MKKVLAFAGFALILAACNNTAKFKPMVDELSSKWDSATSAVTEFATTVKNDQSAWMSSMNSMQVAPEAMTKWDEAVKTQYNELQTSAQANTSNMAGISSELDAFVSSWQAKSQELQSLKEGIAAGKVEGDVQAKIADLTAAANDATTKLEGWKTKFAEVKAAAAAAQQQFADFMSKNAPAAADVR
ncbi:MAG: lipoprotein [Lewinellaceae bacterium]|nr:lipoprotein [Saprospiraceae bacterium]MCB9340587.1 lipoprotein [Lewinellaceae bacterium]